MEKHGDDRADSDPLVGAVLQNKYRITGKLGEGAMGRVYLAENIELPDIRCAIKVLKPELTASRPHFKEEFFKEAKRQAQLKHPNIVQVQDYFTLNGNYFLVLAYIEGQALSDKIDDRNSPISEKEALSIIKDVLKALNLAHQRAVVHQDVKASNILIDEQCARLTDFGIAREMAGAVTPESDEWVGTPEYMSPEQYISPSKIDHRSDVYAVGIVLFEILTRRLPFTGPTNEEILRHQVETPPPDPHAVEPKVSKALARIVLKGLQKNPANRYQGCLDFLKAIEVYERRHLQRKWVMIAVPIAAGLGASIYAAVAPPADLKLVTAQAFDNYEHFCRDSELQLRKTQGLILARKSEQSAKTISDIENQVKELGDNITSFFEKYTQSLIKLKDYEKSDAVSAIKSHRDKDTGRRSLIGNMIIQDDANFRNNGQVPTQDEMLNGCPL